MENPDSIVNTFRLVRWKATLLAIKELQFRVESEASFSNLVPSVPAFWIEEPPQSLSHLKVWKLQEIFEWARLPNRCRHGRPNRVPVPPLFSLEINSCFPLKRNREKDFPTFLWMYNFPQVRTGGPPREVGQAHSPVCHWRACLSHAQATYQSHPMNNWQTRGSLEHAWYGVSAASAILVID